MTTPDKDILNLFHANAKGHIGRAQEAKEWFELYRDGKELPEKGQAFLQDCVRELNGIPHEADNIHNGGDIVPSGEKEQALWKLLDDIDTASDMFKPEKTGYYQYVQKKAEARFGIISQITGDVEFENLAPAGWRDDVPDESIADGEETMVEQEAHDHGGMVVEGDSWFSDEAADEFEVLDQMYGVCRINWANDGSIGYWGAAYILENFKLIKPSQLREQDKQDAGDTVDSSSSNTADQVDDRGVRQDVGSTELKDVADEQDLELSQSETVESDVLDGNAEPSDKSDDSSSDADLISVDAENGENHPLASWIMEQEWPIPINEIDDDFVNYRDGEYDDILPINEFLDDFTPKGWERFDPERSVVGGSYEVIGENGLKAVIDHNLLLSSSEGIIFIREHENEGSEDGNSDTIGDVGNVVSPANLCSGDSGKSRKINEGDGGEYREPLFQNKGTRALDPPNQQAVDLVEGRVGDELDKLEGVE